MLHNLKSLAVRLGKKKNAVELSNTEKISLLSDKALNLLDSFKKTHDELGEINDELREVIHVDVQKVIELESNIERASDEIAMNQALQVKLSDFIR